MTAVLSKNLCSRGKRISPMPLKLYFALRFDLLSDQFLRDKKFCTIISVPHDKDDYTGKTRLRHRTNPRDSCIWMSWICSVTQAMERLYPVKKPKYPDQFYFSSALISPYSVQGVPQFFHHNSQSFWANSLKLGDFSWNLIWNQVKLKFFKIGNHGLVTWE